MKKKRITRIGAILMASILMIEILSALPGMSTAVYAAAPTATQFATAQELKDNFNLTDKTIGRIQFGANGQKWLIAGADASNQDTLALLSDSSFGKSAYGNDSRYSTSIVKGLLEGYIEDTTYFSNGEKTYMADTTVSTTEYDDAVSTVTNKLYLPDAQKGREVGNTRIICVGSNNDIEISTAKVPAIGGGQPYFWLRSPMEQDFSNGKGVAKNNMVQYINVNWSINIVPAFNLSLSSVIFASALPAASSTVEAEGALATADAMTVRYQPAGLLGSAIINQTKTSVTVSGAATGTYLVVQNDRGGWAQAVDSTVTSVSASNVVIDGAALTSFEDCKVWLEMTDGERITTAQLATTEKNQVDEAQSLAEAAITGITATNETTGAMLLEAVNTAIASVNGVTAAWKAEPAIIKATSMADGSITGTIILTDGLETVEVTVDKIILKIPQADREKVDEAKSLAEAAITGITTTNETTAANILDGVTTGISSVAGVTASWQKEPVIIKATSEAAGSITGTIILTCGLETVGVTVNKTIEKLPAPTPELPTISTGNNNSSHQINSGKSMTFTCSGKLEDLIGVYVDGKLVDAKNYTLKSGSTILTLKASYLDTLSLGKHTLKFQYKGNVSAETVFTITAKVGEIPNKPGTAGKPVSPKTGDSNYFVVLLALLLASGGTFTILLVKRRTDRRR